MSYSPTNSYAETIKTSTSDTDVMKRKTLSISDFVVESNFRKVPNDRKKEVELKQLIIENTEGYKVLKVIETIENEIHNSGKEGEKMNEENEDMIYDECIQLVGLIDKYITFFCDDPATSNVPISIRLHYLVYNFMDVVRAFVENVIRSYSEHNWDISSFSLLLVNIRSFIVPMIFIENSMDALDSLPSVVDQRKFSSNSFLSESAPLDPKLFSRSNVVISSLSSTSINTPDKKFRSKAKFTRVQSEMMKKPPQLSSSLGGSKTPKHSFMSSKHSSGSKHSGETSPSNTPPPPVANFTFQDCASTFSNYSQILIERPTEYKKRLDQCKAKVGKLKFYNPKGNFQSDYEEYALSMSKLPSAYYCGYLNEKKNYTTCYSWLPLMYGLTKEDFISSLIHYSISEQSKLCVVAELIENWRKNLQEFKNKYMHMMYEIFIEIIKVHKHSKNVKEEVLKIKDSFPCGLVHKRIWRYPPQYFYILMNPRLLAQKLTEAHVTIFTKCPPRAIFYSKQMRRAGIEAADLKKKVDYLAYLVTQSLYESIKYPSLNKEFHEYFIEVISYLFWLRHNLLATLGLSIGFSSFRTNQFKKPELRTDLKELRSWVDTLTDPKDGSYPNLITAMKELGNPCIPYFGSFQNIFEKVLSADIVDVGNLYLNIGKATEETRRNRIKWNDLVYEDTTVINTAFEMDINQWCETPWSDSQLFNSMVKSNKFRLLHKNEDIPRRKNCIIPLKRIEHGYMKRKRIVGRFMKYSPLV